jgi:hypothetical protein
MITTCEDYVTASRELAALHLVGNALLIVGAAVLFRFLRTMQGRFEQPGPTTSDARDEEAWSRKWNAYSGGILGEFIVGILTVVCAITIFFGAVYLYDNLVDLIAPLNSHSAIEFCNQLDGLVKAGGVK